MMRILFVCTDAEVGGAERFLATLAAAKDPADVLGLVVLMTPGAMSGQFAEVFDEVTYLEYPGSSRNLLGMVRSLRRVIRRFEPDIISSHLFHADLVTLLARPKQPSTTTVHTQAFGEGVHPLTKAIANAVGRLSRNFDAVIPASDGKQMDEFLHALRYKNIVDPIPNAATLPPTPTFFRGARSFLSLARNHPVKGHKILFESFALIADEIPEWTLDAYGPGVTEDDADMRAIVNATGVHDLIDSGRIRFHGPTSEPEDALKAASALIISSIYGEAFPIVGIEAAAAGIPVITTNLGSCAEFADDRTFLVEPGNTEELSAAMLTFARLSDEEREGLSRRARTRAEQRYSPDQAYARYRTLFASLLAEPGSQR